MRTQLFICTHVYIYVCVFWCILHTIICTSNLCVLNYRSVIWAMLIGIERKITTCLKANTQLIYYTRRFTEECFLTNQFYFLTSTSKIMF